MDEGFGRHFWNVPLIITLSNAFLKVSRFCPNKDEPYIPLQLSFLSDWLCNVAYVFVKLTFFILYWNIFYPFRWLKFGIVGGAAVVVSVYSAFTIASFVGAIPPPGHSWLENWETSRDSIGKRLSIPLAILALVSDIYIIILPISGVLRLQLSRKRKFGLSMLFMAGTGYEGVLWLRVMILLHRMLILAFNRAIICSSLSLYYRTLLRDEDVTYTVINIQILV